jgi:alpha-L-fucosidase 2
MFIPCILIKPITRLCFLLAAVAAILFRPQFAAAQVKKAGLNTRVNGLALARKHAIIINKPAQDFFEGSLLGNGAMGVNVTSRPDAIVLYFGHNNVWDIRLAEHHQDELGTFEQVFEKVKKIPAGYSNLTDDPWYKQYNQMAGDNYRKPYPRPFPCGSVLIGFDRREVQVIAQRLDIANGLCTVSLLTAGKKHVFLQLFTDMTTDRLLMRLVDEKNRPAANIFNRVKVMPDPSTPTDIPALNAQENLAGGKLSFRQILPFDEPDKHTDGNAADKAFRLTLAVNGPLVKTTRVNWNGGTQNMALLEAALSSGQPFTAAVCLQEGLAAAVPLEIPRVSIPQGWQLDALFKQNEKIWANYWAKSAVSLGDQFLEATWYRNLYFLNCAAKAGVTCPGLFANWSYNNIGTAWHGDYHMNYNVQQPFWVTFSSNHLEKNLPYVELINALMPVSKKWAKEYYQLPGAYFPHSAYPVAMSINPYPLPDWGWEVSETPWAVQGLWWHYLYAGDKAFLKEKAYEPIKAACQFVTAYMKRADAHGGSRWQDDKYHVFPTVAPELYALRPGFKFNYDCGVDLALIKFIFKAFNSAATALGTRAMEKPLLADISEILSHFPAYPTAKTAAGDEVLVAVPGENTGTVYNVPDALFAAFPGEDYGLQSDKKTLQLLKNTYLNQQNEGGNDLVFANLQAARIGMLDIDAFKRQIRYCLLPNGTAADMVMQTHGRYNDQSDYGYMSKMGIWFENFALPAVINECLMQSYSGTIRLFPNWPANLGGQFENLRAAGAFLVSAAKIKGEVTRLRVFSEQGNQLNILSPWGNKLTVNVSGKKQRVVSGVISVKTRAGQWITISRN